MEPNSNEKNKSGANESNTGDYRVRELNETDSSLDLSEPSATSIVYYIIKLKSLERKIT